MDDPRFSNPKPEKIPLANLDNFNEAKLRDILTEDPTLLGLGDLYVKNVEKTHPKAGRLDLLLSNANDDKERYEVELQFGKTDESHIIRCLEYLDIERRRYPQYDHTAVLVAEDITSRFLNVISLFNGFVPLIALKLTAFKVNDQIMLSFVKVLDKVVLEEEPPQPGGPVKREDWVDRSSELLVSIIDASVGNSIRSILKEISPTLDLKYNQQYIGIQENGISNVFASFIPYKRGFVRVSVRLRDEKNLDEWQNRLTEAGLGNTKSGEWLSFQLKTKENLEQHNETLKNLLNDSYENSK